MTAALESEIRDALCDVIDPELGIDVVSLGMVGEVAAGDDGSVRVDMRLTSMSCPFWDLFIEQVRSAVGTVEGIGEVEVRFDRGRPWSPELMTPEARAHLENVGLMPPGAPLPMAGPPPSRPQLLQIVDAVLSRPPIAAEPDA